MGCKASEERSVVALGSTQAACFFCSWLLFGNFFCMMRHVKREKEASAARRSRGQIIAKGKTENVWATVNGSWKNKKNVA